MMLKDLSYAQGDFLAEQKFYQFLLASGYPQQVLMNGAGPSGRSFDMGADILAHAPGLSTDLIAAFEVKKRISSAVFGRYASIADKLCHGNPGCNYFIAGMEAAVPSLWRYEMRRREFLRCTRIPTYDELTAAWLQRVSHVGELRLRNVTVFGSLKLSFARGLNVLIGENGFGKSTLLKVVYSQAKWASESSRRDGVSDKYKDAHIGAVFGLPASSLVARNRSRAPSSIETTFAGSRRDVAAVRLSRTGVQVVKPSPRLLHTIPAVVFLQAHEILSTYRGYASLWARYAENMSRDGTIIDTVNLLSLPPLRSIPKGLTDVCVGLEKSIGGRIELDQKEGAFFFVETKKGGQRTPIDLTAEGWRKIGQLLILLRNGAIAPGSILIWDEPEANLNPRLEKVVAALLIGIARSGVQIFVATHSLFLANEFEIALRMNPLESGARFINLKKGGRADVGDSLSEIDGITLIEESMSQSDRYMELD